MTSPAQSDRPPYALALPPVGSAASTSRAGSLVLGGLATVLVAFGTTLVGLAEQWWSYFNHGFVLVMLVGWVCWRDRRLLLADLTPWWPAALLVSGASLLWFIGAGSGIQVVEQIAMLGVLVGWALGALGTGRWARVLRLGGYMALAMPAWGLLIGVLQQVTVLANRVLLAMSGLQATISGTYITIPEGTFEVAGTCAGQAFLMSGLTLAVTYWEITPLSRRGRWLALALMAGLSLVSNWIRVFLLILIGHWTAMQSSLMGDHGWFGWVIFAIVLVFYFWAVRFIEARHPAPSAGVELADGSGPAASPKGAAPAGRAHPAAIVAFTVLAAAGPVGVQLVRQLPRAPSPVAIADLDVGAPWKPMAVIDLPPLQYGDTLVRSPWTPRYLGADRHLVMRWSGAADTVQVDRLVFSGRDRHHKLFADGNAMADRRSVLLDRLLGIPDGQRVRSFRQAIVRVDSTNTRAVLYWFRVGNTTTGVPIVGRLYQVSAFIQRSAPEELVAASVACDVDCTRAFETLRTFVIGTEPAAAVTEGPRPSSPG